jgi:hypothetical protein
MAQKKLALERLLQQGGRQGEVTLVVMPVSPIYRKEFLSPRVLREFEGELDEMQQRCPQTRLIRLDQNCPTGQQCSEILSISICLVIRIATAVFRTS